MSSLLFNLNIFELTSYFSRCLLCLGALLSGMASASSETYEIKMNSITINGPQVKNSLEYLEGTELTVTCGYAYEPPIYCEKSPKQQWTIGFFVDGKRMESRVGIWPTKTSPIGVKRGGPACFSKFLVNFKWKSQKGPHNVRCVLNDNGGIVGDSLSNNRMDKKIMVRAGIKSQLLKRKETVVSKEQPLRLVKGHSHLIIKSKAKKEQQDSKNK